MTQHCFKNAATKKRFSIFLALHLFSFFKLLSCLIISYFHFSWYSILKYILQLCYKKYTVSFYVYLLVSNTTNIFFLILHIFIDYSLSNWGFPTVGKQSKSNQTWENTEIKSFKWELNYSRAHISKPNSRQTFYRVIQTFLSATTIYQQYLL